MSDTTSQMNDNTTNHNDTITNDDLSLDTYDPTFKPVRKIDLEK